MDHQLINTFGIVLAAFFTAYTAYTTTQTNKRTTEVLEVSKQTEKNTNSMKDALVLATSISSHAEGKEEGRIQEKDRAATVAEGKSI